MLADMNKQTLAHGLSVSAAAVGQYEAGIITPRPDLLDTMARLLGVPVTYFAAGRPNTRLDASTAHFRSLRSTRVGQRTRAIAFAEQLWELAHALELRVELPAVDLPDLEDPSDGEISPEAAASRLRDHWGIGPGPVRHLVRTMESHGLLVTLLPFARTDEIARVDAFSTSRTPRPLVVLTPDRADDVYRHRFTAAHELGHLLLHTEARPGDIEQEKQADRFAAEFLTPAAEIDAELPGRLRVPLLEPIARRWGVGVDSLVRRSRELGAITEVTARRAYQRIQQLKNVGLLRPEPVTAYPGEVPTLLRSAFDLAEQHGLTVPDLADELAWKPELVRSRLGMADSRPTLTLVQGDDQ
ncbi:ImmA/IrrE family metallo-endopeptidase [Pseudonocardia sp. ICBG162]|uniref:ImmA/IrrE family metallo-endopeptidase n=1 Tax=Pseudonocardia sp. ICBG162 TaxID=2846761 RepID=UPI001CF67D10|nr:XRE family transcriptional regulator [Pseudonocardia sp. ICBG162]